MVRSAATPRVSNHEAVRYVAMIRSNWNTLEDMIRTRKANRITL
jgi:hypothetical protein